MKKGVQQSRAIRTLAEFAAALKTPEATVRGWVRHDAWAFNRKSPWSRDIVPGVLNWAADTLERGRKPNDAKPTAPGSSKDLRDEKLRQEIRKLRANADQAETALGVERGKLHDADQCEEEAVRRASLYRNAVQNVPMQVVSMALSAGLPHEAAPAFQKQVDELLNGCLRYTSTATDTQPPAGDDPSPARAAAA